MYSCKGIYFAPVSFTLLLISSTPNAASSTATTSAGMENIRVYLVIAVFACVNIVYK